MDRRLILSFSWGLEQQGKNMVKDSLETFIERAELDGIWTDKAAA
jgi:hypothetical protein